MIDDESVLRGFFEEAPDAFFLHDLEGKILDVNRRSCESLGYSRAELLSLTIFDLDIDWEVGSARNYWQSLRPGKTLLLSGTHRRRDRTTFPVDIQLGLYVKDGSPVVIAVARDVSERVETEESLKRQIRINRALSEINQAIIRMEDQQKLFPMVCDVAVRFGGMSLAYIAEINPETRLLEMRAISGRGKEYLEGIVLSSDPDVIEGQGPSGTCFRESRIVLVQRFMKDPLTKPWHSRAASYGWGSSGTFPVTRGGVPYAIMGVYHPDEDAFDPEIVRLLDEMTRDISFSLDNFDREKMKREAISKASKSEERFRAYFDSALIGMVALSPDGHFLEINESFLRMTGYTKDELSAKKWEEIKDPEDRHSPREDYDRVIRGEIDFYRKDKRLVRKDGELIYGHTAVRAVRKPSGEVDYFVINIEDVTEKKKSQEMIWRQANFDMLTGLPNRFMFFDRLKEEIKKAHRGGFSLALLFIDLDRFKEVNDTLGHQTGDKLLVEAASRISSCIREADTVSRFGGDEFTVILSHVHAADHIEEVAQNILERLSSPFVLGADQESVFVSASIGITVYPADGQDADRLLRNADQSMYVAKNSGRNRFAYFTSALQEKALRRLVLLNELRGALAHSEFALYFQPIMDLETGKIVKAESLLRWNHPKLGLVCPGEFIAITEETGLIVEIGDFVFREAARWMKNWLRIAPEGFQVSVNMSTVQFQSKSLFMEEWFSYLESLLLPGEAFSIEITESLLLDVDEGVMAKLKAFSRNKIQISIDDFGTGYSSLSYLMKFPINYLKIDQSFVKGLESHKENLAMAEAIVVMGHKLGLEVIAEGVETPGQKDLLTSIGCDFGQGFFFSRPLPPSEFEDFLRRFS